MSMKRTLGIAVALISLLGVAACGSNEPSPERVAEIQAALEDSVQREVVYEVEGTATGISVTMETPTGTSQASDRGVPLGKEGQAPGVTMTFNAGDFVYISAQNEGESGDITCRITIDGVVVSENTAAGAYSIATCKGSA